MSKRITKLYSSKECFLTALRREEPEDFITHLAKLMRGGDFNHSYTIEHEEWRKAHGNNLWECHNLVNAKQQYWWHGNYAENLRLLDNFSSKLKTSIDRKHESDILYWSLRIFEWGEVYKGCVGFVLDKYDEDKLGKTIKDAVKTLEDTNYNVQFFDQNQLRMDSGLTKLYSLASNKSIILDSRVAAALSLIACRFFKKERHKSVNKLKAFACGKSSGKQKKRSHINNKKIFSPILQPHNQAHFNLVTNWMLDAAIEIATVEVGKKHLHDTWEVSNDQHLLRAIEAALFMIGSDISDG